jgi:hypothetical protein
MHQQSFQIFSKNGVLLALVLAESAKQAFRKYKKSMLKNYNINLNRASFRLENDNIIIL